MTRTEAYEEIIENIWQQRRNMIKQYNVEPNRVILGTALIDILKWESGSVYSALARCDGDNCMYVVGLPITANLQDAYTIEVCYSPDKMDMGYLFHR